MTPTKTFRPPQMPLRINSLRALIAAHPRRAVGEACDVDPSAVSRWSTGERAPTLPYLADLEEALGVQFVIKMVDHPGSSNAKRFAQAQLEARRNGVE